MNSNQRPSANETKEAKEYEPHSQVLLNLGNFGQSTIINDWLYNWAVSLPSPEDIQGSAAILMFNNAVEQARSVVALQVLGLGTSALGLISPTYALLRSQLESYWSLHHLLNDAGLRQRNCATFVYCYNMLHYRQSTKAIAADTSLSPLEKQQKQQEQDTFNQNMQQNPLYQSIKTVYSDATWNDPQHIKPSKYPYWYRLCPDAKGKGIGSIKAMAVACGQENVYDTLYDDWSAATHGSAPALGIRTGEQGPMGAIVLGPNYTEIILMANYCIKQTVGIYRYVAQTLLTSEHQQKLETFITEQGILI